jgi:hypothetical protein
VVQLADVALDEPFRLRRRRHDDGTDAVQGARKRSVDVIVVGAGTRQENRRHAAQIDRHHPIVPCGISHRRGG